MICKKPYIAPGMVPFGCGSCLACRINKRRVWAHRIELEAMAHENNSFWTLTYDDEHVPANGSLVPSHLRDFLKRFRKAIEPARMRYFAVGEYGESTQRPHYHVAAFNVEGCHSGSTAVSRRTNSCCPSCDRLRDIWKLGLVHQGELTPQSAEYVAGYTVKKLGDCDADDDVLAGRHPEFARMSLRPGIGSVALDQIAKTIEQYGPLAHALDVPVALRHGAKKKPLGKYLRRKLRLQLGRPENAPPEVLEKIEVEMQVLREAAASAPKGFRTFAFQQALVDQSIGRIAQMEYRQKQADRKKVI